jgi:hypothetical protein
MFVFRKNSNFEQKINPLCFYALRGPKVVFASSLLMRRTQALQMSPDLSSEFFFVTIELFEEQHLISYL